MSDEYITTRVNSARLPQFLQKTVRLTCKVLKFPPNSDTATVEASDGGQVTVKLTSNPNITDTYVEIIGSVLDASTIRMVSCVNLGSDLDLKLIDSVIELIHDPRFYEKMFS